jgi:predicted acetyltransferase
MGLIVRTIEEGEVPGWVDCLRTGFLAEPAKGEAEYRRRGMDLNRTWGAFDGDRVVGTLRSAATTLTLPGPAGLAAAGLTNVTVAPTHRRRGLLTEMITRDLRDSLERGEAAGILIASEYPIYGRFGYGPATESATYSLERSRARFRAEAEGTVELVDRATMRRLAPPIYEAYRSGQPGAIGRDARWWDNALRMVDVPGAEPPKGWQAVYRSDHGDPEGYLRYQATQTWDQMRPDGVLKVDELVASTSRAYHRLWAYCCEVDLITSIEAGDRGVDEPLVWLLADGRALRQTGRFDFVWVRMLDVPKALSARRYLTEGRLVIELVDPLGLAGGRYALDGGPAGATCVRSTESPGLTLAVDALGAVYLGGVSLPALGRAGRVTEHRPGTLATADAMFRSAVTPWCSTWF